MVSSDEINRRLNAKRRGREYQEPIRSSRNSPAGKTAANSKDCPFCHTQNPSTAKFCVGCGKILETPPEEKSFAPEIKGPKPRAEDNTTAGTTEELTPPDNRISQRPDDFGSSSAQKVQSTTTSKTTTPEPTENKKLEPIVPKSPEVEPEKPETTSPKPPQVRRPETIKVPEPPQVEKKEPIATEQKKDSDVDPVEKIKKAKELLDLGAITQEEYDMIKNKYLDEL